MMGRHDEVESGMGFSGLVGSDANEDRCWSELGERNEQLVQAKRTIEKLRAEITQCAIELGEAAKLIAPHYPRTAGIFEEAAGRARVSIGLTPCERPAHTETAGQS